MPVQDDCIEDNAIMGLPAGLDTSEAGEARGAAPARGMRKTCTEAAHKKLSTEQVQLSVTLA